MSERTRDYLCGVFLGVLILAAFSPAWLPMVVGK